MCQQILRLYNFTQIDKTRKVSLKKVIGQIKRDLQRAVASTFTPINRLKFVDFLFKFHTLLFYLYCKLY